MDHDVAQSCGLKPTDPADSRSDPINGLDKTIGSLFDRSTLRPGKHVAAASFSTSFVCQMLLQLLRRKSDSADRFWKMGQKPTSADIICRLGTTVVTFIAGLM